MNHDQQKRRCEALKKYQIMNKMTIASLLISSIFIFSFAKGSGIIDSPDNLLTKDRLKSIDIQLIPMKGIVLGSDSILIRKTGVADLSGMIDTNSMHCRFTIDKPRQLVCSHTGFPHQPDEYFTDYSATLQFDSIVFHLGFNQSGQNILDKDIFMDSLKVTSIIIGNGLNARVFDNLKIGDFYRQIFEYFEKPGFTNQPDKLRSEYTYNGIIFTIETDKSRVDKYGRIIKIEINSLTRY